LALTEELSRIERGNLALLKLVKDSAADRTNAGGTLPVASRLARRNLSFEATRHDMVERRQHEECQRQRDGRDDSKLWRCSVKMSEVNPRRWKICAFVVASWMLIAAWDAALGDSKPAASIPSADLIQPAELVATLRGSAAPKPLILQVGFRTLYDQSHIPGAEYAGAASESEGLRRLRERVAGLPKDTAIVIYCGCCPWSHCPNIAGAHDALNALGFTRVKALYIADNFGSDWVDKGYPATRVP